GGGGARAGRGGASHPTEKEARLFLCNPATHEQVFETVPVAGQGAINDLITAPNGLVYGFAGSSMFVFDPESKQIKAVKTAPFRSTIYNSIAVGQDGRLWGLTADGIFAIDTTSNEVTLAARAPSAISAGFALKDDFVYYVSRSSVWRYRLPQAAVGAATNGTVEFKRQCLQDLVAQIPGILATQDKKTGRFGT